MQLTIKQTIDAAARKIGVKIANNDLTADQYADAMLALNLMMNEFHVSGQEFGYTEASNVNSLLTVDPWAFRYIILKLGANMAPDFEGAVISPLMLRQIEEAQDTVDKMTSESIDADYPPNLPMGGGDLCYTYDDYNGGQTTEWKDFVTDDGQPILLEESDIS